ncbi:biopolymer transporter ExbD [Blochmannia endosymbiont of Polyrhachis (Hedomyrma) turneri]|uniref:biopolymer transporter ExbD n=1 Tax=Blochmannia endosymbiont of Polyrhachis (Hedomyrma) turneri TaxID=1505596 RepID=UPI00061A6F99|nr:biopolymer transporter ExbD [Blochmannia endosymbiont of Polyrhachis (Hedomyrma) turneri]AKC59905.1 Protein tolR [Blochmannia endosymbiont of Polyrhachis (Hedomyrma) turneri]
MKNKKNRYIMKCEINIIPFLDVLLILLLMFMISTLIFTQNFEINLPKSSYTTTSDNTNNEDNKFKIIIEVLGNNNYNLYVNSKKIEHISFDQIILNINSKMKIKFTDVMFFIAGDKNIAYNEIINTLNVLNNIGVTTVKVLTQPIF